MALLYFCLFPILLFLFLHIVDPKAPIEYAHLFNFLENFDYKFHISPLEFLIVLLDVHNLVQSSLHQLVVVIH